MRSAGWPIHPHDVMQLLDAAGVAVRGGHHCARPLHERLGIQSSIRASSYLYTTPAEIDRLADALDHTSAFFGGRVASRPSVDEIPLGQGGS